MSYILDALKKSEQQRQRGAAPSLISAQVTEAAPRRPVALFYGLAAGVLLLAGITIGMLRPWQAEAPVPPPMAVKPPEAVAPPLPPAVAPTPPQAPAPAKVEITINAQAPAPARATQPAPLPASDPVRAPPPAPVAPAQGVPPPKAAAAPANEAPAPAPQAPAGARPASAAPERPPVALAELPVPIQQEIPTIPILFHLYSSNPKDRRVGVSDRILREGDTVAPGLVLEQITPEGMILSYKGYRFLRGSR